MRIQHVNVHRPVDNLTRPALESAQWGQIFFEPIPEFRIQKFKCLKLYFFEIHHLNFWIRNRSFVNGNAETFGIPKIRFSTSAFTIEALESFIRITKSEKICFGTIWGLAPMCSAWVSILSRWSNKPQGNNINFPPFFFPHQIPWVVLDYFITIPICVSLAYAV